MIFYFTFVRSSVSVVNTGRSFLIKGTKRCLNCLIVPYRLFTPIFYGLLLMEINIWSTNSIFATLTSCNKLLYCYICNNINSLNSTLKIHWRKWTRLLVTYGCFNLSFNIFDKFFLIFIPMYFKKRRVSSRIPEK